MAASRLGVFSYGNVTAVLLETQSEKVAMVVGAALAAGVVAAGTYLVRKILRNVFGESFRSAVDADRNDDPEVGTPRPGSLLVTLYFHTAECFLQFFDDYESGKLQDRLKKEFAKINIFDENLPAAFRKNLEGKLEGFSIEDELEVKIVNEAEVEKTRRYLKRQMIYPGVSGYIASDNSLILNGQYGYGIQLAAWLSPQFQWHLAYRASRDGWRTQDFHRCCDNKGPTVTLVKVGEYIFGGYTDQSWGGDGYKQSNSSFLFSLRNKDNLPPFKSVVYRYSEYAIFSSPSWGPTFGGGADLYISNNANTNQGSHTHFGFTYRLPPGYNFGSTYRPPPGYNFGSEQTLNLLAGTYKFTPTEIEVFY